MRFVLRKNTANKILFSNKMYRMKYFVLSGSVLERSPWHVFFCWRKFNLIRDAIMVLCENNDPVPEEKKGKFYCKIVPLFTEDREIDGKFHQCPMKIFSLRVCPTAAILKIRNKYVPKYGGRICEFTLTFFSCFSSSFYVNIY